MLPNSILKKTGEEVTIAGLGRGLLRSFNLHEELTALINRAIDSEDFCARIGPMKKKEKDRL